MRKEEFLRKPEIFSYVDIDNKKSEIEVQRNSLCFTYCQIPVIYKLSDNENLKVVFENGSILEYEYPVLDTLVSKKMFERTGEISHVIVSINKG